MVSRSISLSADSGHASQPHTGNNSVLHRPKRTWSPGKSENVTVIGAAVRVYGTELDGRPRAGQRSFELIVQAVGFVALDVEV